MTKIKVSPSRTYVVMCNSSNFDAFYFRRFTLPPGWRNNSEIASWYWLNRLNWVGCVEECFPVEHYNDISDERTGFYTDMMSIPLEMRES